MSLTTSQIEQMEAGEEMNAAVAELMGWTRKPFYVYGRGAPDGSVQDCWCSGGGIMAIVYEFDPSHDIAAAMDALDDVVGAGYYKIEAGVGGGDARHGHIVEIIIPGASVEAFAATRALAISRALLLTTVKDKP